MAQIQVPDAPKEYATHYEQLLGVDFQADQTEVDRRRSPDMVNMISDFGGNPIKRDGYRSVGKGYDALVMVDGTTYGIYTTSSVFTIYTLSLNGYEFDETAVVTRMGNYGDVKGAFPYQKILYIITDKALLSYDTVTGGLNGSGVGTGMMSQGAVGEYQPANSNYEIIPDTVISLKPDGTAGAVLDDKNLMSVYQRVGYQGDGTATQYKIPNYTKMGTWILAEVKDANGDWQAASASVGTSSAVTGMTLDGAGYETNNIVDTTVTFTTAPPAPTVAGEDNVRITFCPYSMEEVETGKYRGYYNEELVKLLSSDSITFQSSRMFIADKYRIYYSEVSNPFALSDLAWFEIDSEVVGFTRSNSYLAILARDNGRSTIYLASETSRVIDSETGETESYFAVKEP